MPDPKPKPTKRLDKDRLFESIGYDPHEGQLLIHRSKKRRRVLACGTRFGKSTCAAMEIVAGLLEPREATLGWVCAPTYELTKRVMDRVTLALHQHVPHRVESFPREQRLRVVNLAGGTSELRGKSADQPAGLLGEALDFLVVDEATQIRDETWTHYLSPRLIDRRGWSLLLSTPAGPGWFHKAYKQGRRNRDPDTESWSLPTWTNPHIDRTTVEEERGRLTPEEFAQQYEAKFQNVEGEPCDTCGGPRAENSQNIVLPEGQTEANIKRCPECGMFVNDEGLCIVKLWNPWCAHIDVDMTDTTISYSWDDPTGKCQWPAEPW